MSEKISDYFHRNKKNIINIFLIMLAILSAAATTLNFERLADADAESGGLLWEVFSSFRGWGLSQFLIVIAVAYLYHYVYKNVSFQKDTAFFSFILSMLIIVGLCYRNAVGLVLAVCNMAQIIKSFIVLLGYGAILYCALVFLHMWMMNLISGRKGVGESNFQKKYALHVGIFIFFCWLPYLIAVYPGTALYDSGTMLEQFFGYAPLTNHHPYFQILFLGTFVKFGKYLGSEAVGMFLYVLLQMCVFIAVLAYMTDVLRKIGMPKGILNFIIAFYTFVPIFPIYAISVGKNINFSIVFLLLTTFMFEIIQSAETFVHNRKKMILLPILLILLCLFRNEGLAIVISCIPCFIFMAKKFWKEFGIIFVGVLLFMLCWFKCILPFAGVENGSVAEALSIPFMQTARCVCYYGDEMTMEEKEAIDRILEFDTLKERYLPEFSDRVKEKYNNNATEEELQAYWKVWWRQFLEHPLTYVDAVLNKSYGYFYPDDKGKTKDYYVVGGDIYTLNDDGADLKSFFPEHVKRLDNLMKVFREIPLLGYTTSIGFYFWCSLTAIFLLIKCKGNKFLYLFVPAFFVFLVCIASPVNAYFRYGLAVVFTLPFYAAVTIYVMMKQKEKEKV